MKNKNQYIQKVMPQTMMELCDDDLEKIFEKNNPDFYKIYVINESFIDKNIENINWIYVCCYQELTERFIEKYEYKVLWNLIGFTQSLSEKFIEKHIDKLNWENICSRQNISEEFMEKFKDFLDWNQISSSQIMSVDFIHKHLDKINIDYLKLNKRINQVYLKEKGIL